jgi:hypothetical protein
MSIKDKISKLLCEVIVWLMICLSFVGVMLSIGELYDDINGPELTFESGKIDYSYSSVDTSLGEKIKFRFKDSTKEFKYYSTNVKYEEIKHIVEQKHNAKIGFKLDDPDEYSIYYFEDLDTSFIVKTDEIVERNIYKSIIFTPTMLYIFYLFVNLKFGKKRKTKKRANKKTKETYTESVEIKNNEIFLNVVKSVTNAKQALIACIVAAIFGFSFIQIEGMLFQIAGWGLLVFFGIIGIPILSYKAFFKGMAYKINNKGIYSYNFDSSFRFISWEDINNFEDTNHGVCIITNNDFHIAIKNFPINPLRLPLWFMATGNYFVKSFKGKTFIIEAVKFNISNKELIVMLNDKNNRS